MQTSQLRMPEQHKKNSLKPFAAKPEHTFGAKGLAEKK